MGSREPIQVQINTRGVVAALNRLSRDVANPNPALKLSGLLVQGFVQKNFRSQKDHTGKAWPELALSTILRRRNIAKGSIRMLQDTGRLLNSITYRLLPGGFAVGTNVIYAAAQNFGYPPRNLPAREYMWVDEKQQRQLIEVINSWVRVRIKAAGL